MRSRVSAACWRRTGLSYFRRSGIAVTLGMRPGSPDDDAHPPEVQDPAVRRTGVDRTLVGDPDGGEVGARLGEGVGDGWTCSAPAPGRGRPPATGNSPVPSKSHSTPTMPPAPTGTSMCGLEAGRPRPRRRRPARRRWRWRGPRPGDRGDPLPCRARAPGRRRTCRPCSRAGRCRARPSRRGRAAPAGARRGRRPSGSGATGTTSGRPMPIDRLGTAGVHGVLDEPEAVLVVHAVAELRLDLLAVPERLPRVGGLVHQRLDHDHLPGEPARLADPGSLAGHDRPDLAGALRVDRLPALGELLPRLEVGVDLVSVHGLEGQVHRVVDRAPRRRRRSRRAPRSGPRPCRR